MCVYVHVYVHGGLGYPWLEQMEGSRSTWRAQQQPHRPGTAFGHSIPAQLESENPPMGFGPPLGLGHALARMAHC